MNRSPEPSETSHASADPLDAALAAAFAGGAEDPAEDAGLGPDRGPTLKRYVGLREIARGGFGVVYRAVDIRFGRDVALKTLRLEHCSDPRLRRRFLREARITARLDHPGIPPVHDVGRLGPRRPFFALRLVRGRTLADILAEPERKSADPALLAAFLKTCETVGFAHSRGVVHRDLKPSNLMIGGFGEVQVMDWGLAKDLGAPERDRDHGLDDPPDPASPPPPDSIPGAVMGTLAYLAPERLMPTARQDARSDVFALGLVLVEILTGVRAYVAATTAELAERVRTADLGEAFDRLDKAAADPGLKLIAKLCLTPTVEDRPAHAGFVADALREHFAAVEERARGAMIDAATARVEGSAQRRLARRTAVFSIGIAVLIVAVAAGYVVHEHDAAGRRAATERRAWDAVDLARAKLAQAEAGGADELLVAAMADASAAESIVQASEFAVERRGALASSTEALKRRGAEIAEARRRRIADQAFVDERDRIRRRFVAGYLPGADDAYATAFAARGYEIDTAELSELAARLAADPVAAAVSAGIDEWSLRVVTKTAVGPERLRRLGALQKANTSNSRRERVRTAARNEDVEALIRESQAPDALDDPGFAALLGDQLARCGRTEEAGAFLGAARLRHPSDFWIAFEAGLVAARRDDPDAEAHFSAAVAIRPDAEAAWAMLGEVRLKADRVDAACAALEQAVRLAPEHPAFWNNLATARLKAKDIAGAREAYDRSVALGSWIPSNWHGRGIFRAICGDHEGALADAMQAIALDPTEAKYQAQAGEAELRLGRVKAAEKHLRAAYASAPKLARSSALLGAVLNDSERHEEAIAPLTSALAAAPEDRIVVLNYLSAAAVVGRLNEAEIAAAAACLRHPKDADIHWVAARVRLLRGDPEGALTAAAKAVQLAPKSRDAKRFHARALAAVGRFSEAVAEYAASGEQSSRGFSVDDVSKEMNELRRRNRIIADLDAVLAEIDASAPAEELRDVAVVCRAIGRPRDAATISSLLTDPARADSASISADQRIDDLANAALDTFRSGDRPSAADLLARALAVPDRPRAASRVRERLDLAPLRDP